jgi:sugar phosphate isomerase/epimerase
MRLGFIGDNDLPGVRKDAWFAREHGFAGLEYNYWGDFAQLTSETVEQMHGILDEHGVGCSMLGIWGWNHLSPDPAERATAHEMFHRAIEFATMLEADVLTAGGGDIPGATLEEKVAEFLKVFPPLLEAAWSKGLKVSCYAVHGNSFFDSLQAYEMVWEHIPEVTMKYDPANWQHHGDDYLEVVRRHGDKLGHVHIKEHLYHNGELVSQPAAGMGDIEWGKVMAFLYEWDYQGYLSFEPHGDKWSRPPLRDKMLLITKRYLEQFLV